MSESPGTVTIDLPPPPLGTTQAAEKLRFAGVALRLANGHHLEGELRELSYARRELYLRDGTRVPFRDLACLDFTLALPLGTPDYPIGREHAGFEYSPDQQVFRVQVRGGERRAGQTRGSLMDAGGLHLFRLTGDNAVRRVFLPRENLQAYQVGPLMGEALVRDQAVSPQAIEAALQQQNNQSQAEQSQAAVPGYAMRAAGGVATRAALAPTTPRRAADQKVVSLGPGGAAEPSGGTLRKKLGEQLEEMGEVSDEDYHRVLAAKMGIPFVKLDEVDISEKVVNLVPHQTALKYTLIPLFISHGRLVVAMDDPFNAEAVNTIQFLTNYHLELVTAGREDIKAAIRQHYDEVMIQKDILNAEQLQSILNLDTEQERELKEAEGGETGRPVVRLVTKIVLDAIRQRASDIHIRPLEKKVELLYRIDGSLVKMRVLGKSLLPALISRIKIIGRMNIAERRLPQDGQARVNDKGNLVDMRISIMPTVNGESAVIRLLNTQAGIKSIADLGFGERDAEVFADMLHKSYGMILVTGPTGSGKSTTLYAALHEVMQQNLNIITVEDPVEYHIDGIEQIQVNTVPGYTFARALRHILRHDPDAIMIGEIRDEETGKIAVESALTGHLVLSTLHTNDAAGAITRLLEMGVDPFLISATVLGVFAQRLVKRNCPHCLEEEVPDPQIVRTLGVKPDEVFQRGKGCPQCNDTGYSGRLAVYELLKLSTDMHPVIKPGASVDEVRQKALAGGMVPLTRNALEQARKGLTSLTEVYRVRLDS